jgi:hypothetical protein
MSRKDFVDKNLFGLKDKLRNYSMNENVEKTAKAGFNPTSISLDSQAGKKQTKKGNESENIKEKLIKKTASPRSKNEKVVTETLPSLDKNSEKDSPLTSTSSVKPNNPLAQTGLKDDDATIDKEYFKALVARKKEFVHTRSDILKRIKLNLEKLPIDIEKYEKQLAESKKIKKKLEFLIEEINTVKEKEWDKKNFSLDLANAMKKVENARLELFALQQKTTCLLEDDIPELKKNRNSFVPELTSLSSGQIFKLGASFFFPLILGLLLTGILISIAMFIAMGVF